MPQGRPSQDYPLVRKSRRSGRPIERNTPLARVIVRRGYKNYQVAGAVGIAPRTLGHYTAGTKWIRLWHLTDLARFLRVRPGVLIEDRFAHHYPNLDELKRLGTPKPR